MYHRLAALGALLLAAAGCGREAHSAACDMIPAEAREAGRVAEVVDGDTVVLSTGAEVRLVGIQAPKLALGRPGFKTWPLGPEARAALAEIAQDRRAWTWSPGNPGDRYGRVLAHVYVEDGEGARVWLQGAMLSNGLARVYTFADNRACVEEMLAAERRARAAGLGLWALDAYRVFQADEVARLRAREGFYDLVEGRVRKAAVVRGRGYLNFGDDWKTDFTVTVAPGDLRLFRREGTDFAAYEGRRVRARGWIRSFNGPVIEATHPEQIEVLE